MAEATPRRLIALREAIRDLSRTEAREADRLLTDRVLRAAVERWLQVAIEACIDLATAVIAEEGWTPPEHARSAFKTLAAHGLIAPELARKLGSAAGLRNLIVHDYADLDVDRMALVVAHDVADLEAFADVMARRLAASAKAE